MFANDYKDERIIRRPFFIFNRNNERRSSFIVNFINTNNKKLKMDEEKII
jgi:hypothetical protein